MLSSKPDPGGSPCAPTAQTEFVDDLTALEPPLVRLARIEEMNYLIMDLDVWEIVDRDLALERMSGMKPIPLRWVDINKGSETSKECRSRGCDGNKTPVDDCTRGQRSGLQCHTTLGGCAHAGFTGDAHQGSHRIA